ncbi:hypothetical protein, conserved [Babesia bigemina]|uniref:Uncharacterized protein n=1 Tax=Babesia bigemina TaxID=5866 RepID=A0A061DDM1_BABBI|nr:hypothetical protein, conserved [Babesia bigemina]CDR96375.1 hypothetical protein, conserved [Babesia bigemina]|eukprot:XP_012768561.1 hypothetical protein, conserved [Babesia bigemina]
MRGRGGSRGRGGIRGKAVSSTSRGFPPPPAPYGHANAGNPKPPPVQARQGGPASTQQSFRQPPESLSVAGSGSLKHTSAAVRPMYGNDVVRTMHVPAGNPQPYQKAAPFKAQMRTHGSKRAAPSYEQVPQEHTNMHTFNELMKTGVLHPMMLGQFVPMFSMGAAHPVPEPAAAPPSWKRTRSPPPKRPAKAHVAEDAYVHKMATLEYMVDAAAVQARMDFIILALSKLHDAMSRIKITIPSIFRIRNNFRLRAAEEEMIGSVEEVYRFVLITHLAKAHKLQPPYDFQRSVEGKMQAKEPLLQFAGAKSNLAVINVDELQSVISNQPLHYNPNWSVLRWDEGEEAKGMNPAVSNRPYYVRAVQRHVPELKDGFKHAVFLRAINVQMFEEHLDVVHLLCNVGPSAREAVLRAMGYYALSCDDDAFITLASSILPALDSDAQVQFYRQIAQLIDPRTYRLATIYVERYFERILPMCLAVPDTRAWASTIVLLMRSVDPLRLGVKSSNTAITLLRTLKSWCNVFVKCEDTCVEVFNKCIQLVLQAGDDSRIVIRGAAADLAVQIWLNAKGKAAVLNKIGYDTVRTLGCISGVQAIKFNIWSDLLTLEAPEGAAKTQRVQPLDLILSRMDQYDAVEQSLHHEESAFVISLLTAEPSVLGYLINWYLLRYCKITKTVFALEKIASVIRFALVAYPRIAKLALPHTSHNVGTFCCWMLNMATNCSVGSGCLELANIKMALFVDWLFFNYQYNARIIRLCFGAAGTAQCDQVLNNMHQCRRLFVKELAKCVFITRRPDNTAVDDNAAKIDVLLGTNEVLTFTYNTAVDTFRRLVDYLLNAVLHYHSEVGIVAVNAMSAIFMVSVLEMPRAQHTLGTLLRALKNTMLGRMCSVLDISLEGITVYIAEVGDRETTHVLQLKTALQPLHDKYTMVVAVKEKHRNACYDETLKALMLQCYGMVLEYIINVDSLNAIYHGNHLTVDTLRANQELELLEQTQCPKLYTNVAIVNTDSSQSGNGSAVGRNVNLRGDAISDISDGADSDSISDISSDDDEPPISDKYSISGANREKNGGLQTARHPDGLSTTSEGTALECEEKAACELSMSPTKLRELVQQFVHASMDNPAKDFAADPLYTYLKNSLVDSGEPNYAITLLKTGDSSYTFRFVQKLRNAPDNSKAYAVAHVVDVVASYLLETALQCLQDDASSGASFDSILFKEWVVHIFNAFVRLCVAVYTAGYVSIVWELLYYIAAVTTAKQHTGGHARIDEAKIQNQPTEKDMPAPARKKLLIVATLLFNTVDSVTQIKSITQDSVMMEALEHVIKRVVGRVGADLATIVQNLMPMRFTLETVFKSSFNHFGRLPSIMGMVLRIAPVTAITSLIDIKSATMFNVFKEAYLKGSEAGPYVRALFALGSSNPMQRRHSFIAWQIVCRMYEMAFCTNKMRQTLKQERNFLKVTSTQTLPKNMGKLPFITEADVGENKIDRDSILCYLGVSGNKRVNFMSFQRGYTFAKELFVNEHVQLLSHSMVDAFKAADIAQMQIALFSAFPIFVHSVPTQGVIRDVMQSLATIWPKKRVIKSQHMQFVCDMLLALITHWLARYPHLLTVFDHGLPNIRDALDQLAIKYSAGRTMQFAFNGTTLKVQLEHVLALRNAV